MMGCIKERRIKKAIVIALLNVPFEPVPSTSTALSTCLPRDARRPTCEGERPTSREEVTLENSAVFTLVGTRGRLSPNINFEYYLFLSEFSSVLVSSSSFLPRGGIFDDMM
jgi:hypothetical protein